MKKVSIKYIVGLFALLVIAQSSFAGKDFKGIISYKITYESDAMNEQMLAMLPSTMTMILKGNKTKTSMATPMGNQTTIFNGDKREAVNLMDVMGQKLAITQSTEEIEQEHLKYPNVQISILDETKEIAGYECKKAEVKVNSPEFGGDAIFVVYYTEELGSHELNFSEAIFKDINGVMLQYEVITHGMKMIFEATSVKQEKIQDKVFEIPSDYKKTTKEELKAMFGGGM